MNTRKIADLTIEDLNQLIEQAVERKMRAYMAETERQSVTEILAEIDRNMWRPPSDAKSSLQFLREDRDA